jgi:hypothetical protein
MAARFRKVDPRIWVDERFRLLSLEGKLLAFWMLTTSRLNRCGIILWSPGLASEETGIPRSRIDTVCHTVCDTLFWKFDPASNTLFLARWWRYNKPDNAKALQGFLADLHDLPACSLGSSLVLAAQDLTDDMREQYLAAVRKVDTVYHTVSPPETETETEKEKDTDSKEKRNSRFIEPTFQEVSEYCRERENHVDADRFIDHYTSNGWMVGKSKMKDWQAAVRTWEKNPHNHANGQPAKKTPAQLALERFGNDEN